MKTVILNGKTYRVAYDGSVEVRIPAGEPRVMRDAKNAYWRTVKSSGKVAAMVRSSAN